ncbi:hypothetical protein [Marivirga sp.]|uniref:hypothetical protein n=1 Tax=Marivirga sp. TaxID=2018662 RepID=UPI0025ED3EFD|nr:hypothetical protein [Marivirga sp.]
MKKNVILSASAIIMQIVRVLIAVIASLQILIFIGSFTNSLSLDKLIVESQELVSNQDGFNIIDLTTISPWLAFFIVLQNLIILVLLFNILGYGNDIVKNIHSLKTFTKDNIKAFDKISQLSVLLVIVKFIKLSPDKIGIGIELNYVFLAFGAIILTQVFKEGHRLLTENELTV